MKRQNKIKLIAFDWNGTILSDLQGIVRANNAVFKHLRLPEISVSKFQQTYQTPIYKYWEALGHDLESFKSISSVQERVFLENYAKEEARSKTRIGIRKLLGYIKSKEIDSVIFSNHLKPDILRQLDRLKLAEYFSEVFGRAKNERTQQMMRFKEALLQKYVTQSAFLPNEVAVVGDTEEEIEIGQKLGYTTIALTGGHHTEQRLKLLKPDYLVSNPSKIIEILQYHVK